MRQKRCFGRAPAWLLLILVSACRSSAPDEPTPTPPPVEQVECVNVMEWIRLRPLAKSCTADEDCTLQSDGCCDFTVVHKRYARTCERRCDEQCPQDTLVGRQVEWRPVCQQGVCNLVQMVQGESAVPGGAK